MLSVLHIESSQFILKLYRKVIESRQARYLPASSLTEALEILENEKVSLIISAGSVECGIEGLLTKLNETRFNTIPVVVSSSNDSHEERARLFSLGIVDYIVKDRNDETLDRFINKMAQLETWMESLKSLSVAVLDDSEIVHLVIRRSLSIYGIKKIKSYYVAEEVLKAPAHDVYLVDINLPDISGVQAFIEIRKRFPQATILAVSAVDDARVISNALVAGANDYLVKPFSSVILFNRLLVNARLKLLEQDLAKETLRVSESQNRDGLTGLLNHPETCRRLEIEAGHAQRLHYPLTAVRLKLEGLRELNARHGYQVGDEVLASLAGLLENSVRGKDLIGHFGAGEFFVIIPEAQVEAGLALGERVRERMAGLDSIKELDLAVRFSLVALELQGQSSEDLMRRLDFELNRKRDQG